MRFLTFGMNTDLRTFRFTDKEQFMWWEDREKVRQVIELERVIAAIQDEIAIIELEGDLQSRIPGLFDEKLKTVRERDAITQRSSRGREAGAGNSGD